MYYYKSDYNKAEKQHKRALTIRKNNLGFYSSAVETSLHNLAEASMKQEEYNGALTRNLQSLDILEKIRAPENAYMSKVLHDIGWLYYRRGNYEKAHRKSDYKQAEVYYLRALRIRDKLFQPNNPNIQSTLDNLASLYRKTDQEVKAEEIEKRIEK